MARSTQPLLLCTFCRDLVDSGLAGHDILNRGQNGRPVFENGKGNLLPHTIGNKI